MTLIVIYSTQHHLILLKAEWRDTEDIMTQCIIALDETAIDPKY